MSALGTAMLGDSGPFPALILPGSWNGFDIVAVDAATVDAIALMLDIERVTNPDTQSIIWRDGVPVIVTVDGDDTWEDAYPGFEHEGTMYYPLGAYSWTWTVAE